MTDLLYWTLLTGVASALATGLGAPLVFLIPADSEKTSSFASAIAAGMMISASVFSLAQEGINMQGEVEHATLKVIMGMLVGTAFLWGIVERIGDEEDGKSNQPRLKLTRSSLLLFIALFVHSMPEGVAIGVGFATGDFNFGIVMAIAISIHNVPEGIALSLEIGRAHV